MLQSICKRIFLKKKVMTIKDLIIDYNKVGSHFDFFLYNCFYVIICIEKFVVYS